MKHSILIIVIFLLAAELSAQTASEILLKVDRNLSSENRVFESSMTISGKRNSRTILAKTYAVGNKKSFTEYLSPASEKGTKMLKLEKQLWLYSPGTDRTIQLSGHMLRQSVMGSDLSYEDMMDDRKLSEMYDAQVVGEEMIGDRKTILLELTARLADVAYHSQRIWVDAERFVPLKQELFAKGGKLLKSIGMTDVILVQNRWFPMTMTYKDMLKQGEGTVFKLSNIEFDKSIPEYIFTKAALKK